VHSLLALSLITAVTLQLTLGDLGAERIKRLLKEQPNTLNAKTAVALLDRTDLFAAGAPVAASAAQPR